MRGTIESRNVRVARGGRGEAASASTTSFLDQKKTSRSRSFALSFTVHGFVDGRLLIRSRLNLDFQRQLSEGNQAVRPTSFGE